MPRLDSSAHRATDLKISSKNLFLTYRVSKGVKYSNKRMNELANAKQAKRKRTARRYIPTRDLISFFFVFCHKYS